MTRRTFTLAVAAATTLRAETARERGRGIIDKTIHALGGDAFRNMRTRTETGRAYSFYRERLSGLSIAKIYTKYLPADATADQRGLRQLQRQVLGKKEDEAVLMTATEGYDVTYRGAKPIEDDQVARFHETTLHDIFYILRERINEPGLEIEALGTDVVENQRVEAVDIFDSENRSITVWLNAADFLPVKQRSYHYDPVIKDRREEVSRYTKYRNAGNGVMWPFATERERDTEKVFQLFSDKVTVDDPLNDSLFALPNGITILKK
jgi:translation elongation factor P/translation initiation factor 5A